MTHLLVAGTLLLLTGRAAVNAQGAGRVHDHNMHGWYMYFGDHPVRDTPWGIHLEGQWRRHDAITRWQQLLLRPGVNYEVSPTLMLTAGYGFIKTHRYGDFPVAIMFPEQRLFQQALLRHAAGRVSLQHRYRLEQRFLGEMSRDAEGEVETVRYRHENRFRYMLRANVPLQGRGIGPESWYLGLYNEFFINFGRNVAANVFDQNRAYAAIGRGLGRIGRLETGYMAQVVQQRNGRVFEINHTIQVALYSALPFGRR